MELSEVVPDYPMVRRVTADRNVGDRCLTTESAKLPIEPERVEGIEVQRKPRLIRSVVADLILKTARVQPGFVRILLSECRNPLVERDRALPL